MDEKIKALAMALYLALEEENYQSFCFMLNWMFNLYPDSNYMSDATTLETRFKTITRNVRIQLDNGWHVKQAVMTVKLRIKK